LYIDVTGDDRVVSTLVITAVGAAILGLLGIPLQEKTTQK
jgi:hypothetical protein